MHSPLHPSKILPAGAVPAALVLAVAEDLDVALLVVVVVVVVLVLISAVGHHAALFVGVLDAGTRRNHLGL